VLNNVPTAINSMARNVVLNHPNAYNVVIMRKQVNRAGGATIGGMAVMDSEDEDDISYSLLGNAFALQTETYADGFMMERLDAAQSGASEERYLIEPEILGAFTIKKHDIMYKIIGNVRLAYEINNIEATGNIAPYNYRYVCNISDELTTVI